jgi:hypothetical protein
LGSFEIEKCEKDEEFFWEWWEVTKVIVQLQCVSFLFIFRSSFFLSFFLSFFQMCVIQAGWWGYSEISFILFYSKLGSDSFALRLCNSV